jgi:hypothetical protein
LKQILHIFPVIFSTKYFFRNFLILFWHSHITPLFGWVLFYKFTCNNYMTNTASQWPSVPVWQTAQYYIIYVSFCFLQGHLTKKFKLFPRSRKRIRIKKEKVKPKRISKTFRRKWTQTRVSFWPKARKWNGHFKRHTRFKNVSQFLNIWIATCCTITGLFNWLKLHYENVSEKEPISADEGATKRAL